MWQSEEMICSTLVLHGNQLLAWEASAMLQSAVFGLQGNIMIYTIFSAPLEHLEERGLIL